MVNDDLKRWSQLVAKAWEDDKLRRRLLAEPAAVLKENGLHVPGGVEVKVVENTDKTIYLTLPSKPQVEELRHAEAPGAAVISRPPMSLPCVWPLCIRCL